MAALLPSLAFAQSTPVARLQKFTHAVTSLDKTLPFYRDVLGLTVTGDSISRQPPSGTSLRVVTLEIPNATFDLELTELMGSPRQPSVPRAQDIGVATLVLNVPDAQPLPPKALAAGATLVSTRGFPAILVFRDPDGFFVQVQSSASRAETPRDIAGPSFELNVASADKAAEFLGEAIGFDVVFAARSKKNPLLDRMGLAGAEWRRADGHLAGQRANFRLNEFPGSLQGQLRLKFRVPAGPHSA